MYNTRHKDFGISLVKSLEKHEIFTASIVYFKVQDHEFCEVLNTTMFGFNFSSQASNNQSNEYRRRRVDLLSNYRIFAATSTPAYLVAKFQLSSEKGEVIGYSEQSVIREC